MSIRWLMTCLLLTGLTLGCGGTAEIKPASEAAVKVDPKTYENQMQKSIDEMKKKNPQMAAQMEQNMKKMTSGSPPGGTTPAPAEAPPK